jgi:hypothetical protein
VLLGERELKCEFWGSRRAELEQQFQKIRVHSKQKYAQVVKCLLNCTNILLHM